VRALLAVPEFLQCLVVGLGLGVDESLESEGIAHTGRLPSPIRGALGQPGWRRIPDREALVGRLREITLGLLGVLILGGLAGGLALLTDPTGGRLGLTVDELPGWPLLGDYTVPGLALIVLFGVFPMAAFVQLIRRRARGWTLTTAVGLLLVFWMLGQVAAIGLPAPLIQTGFLVVGVLLVGLGLDGETSVGGIGTTAPTGRARR
jgi:hypothetical protein